MAVVFSSRTRSGRALTLLELLIVVGIIALLATILLPSLNKARKQTNKTICKAYDYQLGRVDACRAAEMRLHAFDCGCYGELGKGLEAFRRPPDVTDEELRRQLEEAVATACRPTSGPGG